MTHKRKASIDAALDEDGKIAVHELGDGTPDNSTFLRGDRRWEVPPGGAGGTPGDTVVGETAFGQAPAAGIDLPYSRRDHTHGSPTNPVPAHEAAGDPHSQYTLSTELVAHEGAADPHTGYQRESEKGFAGGYAALDVGGTVPDAQIPAGVARDAEVATAVANHEAAGDPHTQYTLSTELTAHEGAADPHTGYQRESEKGAANGYAGLGAGGLVPMAQLASGTPDGTKFIRDDGTLQTPAGGGTPTRLRVLLAAPGTVDDAWTNMPAALSFYGNTATQPRCVTKADLTNFTQVRFLVFKANIAGAAGAKLILRYVTAFTTVVADWLDIGASEVSVAVNVQNTPLDTGFINLVAGAKADVVLTVVGSGGDGALDPRFGLIVAEFK